MARPRNADTTGDTRERILRESARLFSELGYQGRARGRSPSGRDQATLALPLLRGQGAIGHELIAARLAPTTLLTGQFEHSEDDPALDLYRLFRNEMIVEFNETIDTRWLFRQPPAVAELFPEWGEAVEAGRSTMEAVLERGIRAGVFLPGHPKAVLELFDAIANEAMFWPRDLHSVQPDTFARCSCVSSSPTSPRSPRWSSERRRPRDTWLRFEAGHRRRRHDC